MIARILAPVLAHFETHKRRSKWQFFWRISLEGLLMPLLVVAALGLLFEVPPRTDLDGFTPLRLVIAVVILAPFFETLLSQALPVRIGRGFGFGFWGQVVTSIPFFAAPHFPSGIGTGVGAGIVGGFYLGFTYARWRQESFRSALWMTSGMHAVHNLILVGVMWLVSAEAAPHQAPEPTTRAVTARAPSSTSQRHGSS